MTLFRPTLRQMNVPNGSLGHLISELILFAPVPAQLNLKEVPVQFCTLGGSCFKTLKTGPPMNPSYIPRGYDNQRGTADQVGSVSCFAGETSSSRNQNVLSFTRMTHGRLDSGAVHIFRV